MIDDFNQVNFVKPVDLVISRLREMITSGEVKPGEKLPPERKLAENYGASRAHVREAIYKLQYYGIVKVQPQSGTIVTGIGDAASKGLITDFLKIDKSDFTSLVETRTLLEKESARLAALNRTEEDILQLKNALEVCENKFQSAGIVIEEDLLIHLKIAEASKNNVLKSIMMLIIPNVGSSYKELDVYDEEKSQQLIKEHRLIVKHIIDQNPQDAVIAMENHLRDIKEFSISLLAK